MLFYEIVKRPYCTPHKHKKLPDPQIIVIERLSLYILVSTTKYKWTDNIFKF